MTLSTSNKSELAVKARLLAKALSRNPILYVCLLGVVLSAGAVWVWLLHRPSVQRAEQLLIAGDSVNATAMLADLATRGDNDAALRLGVLYASGKNGVPQNFARATPFLRQAASANLAEAQVLLGAIAYRGDMEKPNYPLALHYLSPLEHSDHGAALSLLGRMYYFGQGVDRDVDHAAALLRRAMALGDDGGADILGRMYHEGAGVPRDDGRAEELLRKIPPGIDNDVDLMLGKLYYLGLDGERDLPRAALRLRHAAPGDDPRSNYYLGMIDFLRPDEANGHGSAAAAGYLEKALRLGVEEAHMPLALLYYRGDVGGGPDYAAAMRHLGPALAAGADGARELLGEMYYYGRGVPQDYDKAAEYLLQAVAGKTGDEKFNYLLGVMYYNGQGVEKDYKLAAGHIMHAANAGNPEARVLMATLYYYGRGVPVNMREALQYLTEGVAAGDPAALALRGRMYFYGDGGEWDEEKAREMLRRAARAGNEEAEILLLRDSARTDQRGRADK